MALSKTLLEHSQQAEVVAMLHDLRLRPSDLERDWVRAVAGLSLLPETPVLVLDRAESASPEVVDMLEHLYHTLSRGLFLVLCREDHPPSALVRTLSRLASPGTLHTITLSPLSHASVCQALERREPGDHSAHANLLLQRSDGNITHLLALLEEGAMRDLSLPTRVEEALLGETEGWSAAVLAALRVWSAIHLPFDEHLAM